MKEIEEFVSAVLEEFDPTEPEKTALKLQEFWSTLETNKGINLIKADQRKQLGAIGVPIPDLKIIGKKIADVARTNVDAYLKFAILLWEKFGREGRVVSVIIFGAMELVQPQRIVPVLKSLCRGCISWEDADRMAMDAVEPILRLYPDTWVDEMECWLVDDNKWVRRAAITCLGRLPMKQPDYLSMCLEDAERVLSDAEPDVKKAVSFAIRLCAKVDVRQVITFMEKQIPPQDPNVIWVLCDVIKSMDQKLLGEFSVLTPRFIEWSQQPGVSAKDQRSISGVVNLLKT